MSNSKLDQKRALAWRAMFTLALLASAAYILQRHWPAAIASLRVMRGASPGWLLLALLATAATFCIAAAIYGVLALHRLQYRQTLLISLASAFVGRLLPAGLGGLGLNGVYLYRRRHTPAEATVVVSVNNLLGMVAHLVLLALLLATRPTVIQSAFARHAWNVPWSWGVWLAGILCAVACIPAVRRPLTGLVKHLVEGVRRLDFANLLLALLLSGVLTAAYTYALYAAAHSIGVSLGLLPVFIVFSFGMLAGTVTPTPGGLVGAEAGLYAGFVAFGVAQTDAGAAVVLFRLLTYWLPLIPGAAALWAARRRSLI